jgi:hypothetical protein
MTEPSNSATAVYDATPGAVLDLAKIYGLEGLESFLPVLPILNLKGKPYTLDNHAPFEPLFKLRLPRRMYYKCGRQVAKTTSMTAQAVLQTGTQPHFAMLFVSPRYEQIRRVSSLNVKPFIEDSVIRAMMQDQTVENSVLQKTFLNGSRMYFSFAFLDADRIRGLSVDAINYDEIQDIDITHIPVIREAMSASPMMMERFFGTPKTLDNTLQALWEESSQAEWMVKCPCGHDNIPALDYDLLKMIGPFGPICSRCGSALNCRKGQWIHAVSELRQEDAGYHVPQIVLPMHYEDPGRPHRAPEGPSDKWMQLLQKRDGRGGYSTARFLNEVLGESCDLGQKLITLADIKQASVLNKNEWRDALDRVGDYAFRAVGVDWGGGGEDGISTTTIAVVGLSLKSGKTECFYTERLNMGFDTIQEARRCLEIFKAFQGHIFCHDYCGAGSIREAMLLQAGLPLHMVVPLMYVRAANKKMVEVKKPSGFRQRVYHTLDKARSLVLLAQCIRSRQVLLPEFTSSERITKDLLALIEERMEARGKADVFLVSRSATKTDDFAHALNYACIGIWHSQNRYPDLSRVEKLKLTADQRRFISPANPTYEGA